MRCGHASQFELMASYCLLLGAKSPEKRSVLAGEISTILLVFFGLYVYDLSLKEYFLGIRYWKQPWPPMPT